MTFQVQLVVTVPRTTSLKRLQAILHLLPFHPHDSFVMVPLESISLHYITFTNCFPTLNRSWFMYTSKINDSSVCDQVFKIFSHLLLTTKIIEHKPGVAAWPISIATETLICRGQRIAYFHRTWNNGFFTVMPWFFEAHDAFCDDWQNSWVDGKIGQTSSHLGGTFARMAWWRNGYRLNARHWY